MFAKLQLPHVVPSLTVEGLAEIKWVSRDGLNSLFWVALRH